MKVTTSITIAPALLQRLRRVAKSENRSVSQQIEVLVERHINAVSGTPPDTNQPDTAPPENKQTERSAE
ncbi:MAG TPA: hypothetical protein VG796_21200 [Verrucomicrobiales bacterium]|jgi:hypothetical protein|nr:hypothetical protein [Verrucomicrobiales bacterium]